MSQSAARIVNLLLVTDRPEQGRSLRSALAFSQYLRILAEVTTREAYEYLAAPVSEPICPKPDLLAIDVPDSGPDGIDAVFALLRKIKTKAELRGIPAVMFCGEEAYRQLPETPEGCQGTLIRKPQGDAALRWMAYHFGEYWGRVARIPPRAISPSDLEDAPISEAVTKPLETEACRLPEQRTIEILVVDDNDDDALLFQESLADNGQICVSQILDDGERALEFLRKQGPFGHARSPDLLVLDIHMPRKTGLRLLDEIQADRSLRRFPVVMLTASQDEQDIWEAYSRGACGFVEKPPRFERFRELAIRFANYWTLLAHLPPREPD